MSRREKLNTPLEALIRRNSCGSPPSPPPDAVRPAADHRGHLYSGHMWGEAALRPPRLGPAARPAVSPRIRVDQQVTLSSCQDAIRRTRDQTVVRLWLAYGVYCVSRVLSPPPVLWQRASQQAPGRAVPVAQPSRLWPPAHRYGLVHSQNPPQKAARQLMLNPLLQLSTFATCGKLPSLSLWPVVQDAYADRPEYQYAYIRSKYNFSLYYTQTCMHASNHTRRKHRNRVIA
jgi:hypothetical protein